MGRKRRRAIDSDSFACCNEHENITFLDYSCGCGEFLLAVIQYFDNHVLGYSRKKLATQLRGVDVNPIALMITIARIVSAVEAEDDENLLLEVAKNFVVGNPLLHSDKIAPLGVRFDNFALNRLYAETEGINCLELEQQNLVVLGNPPWEKLRFEERAFFRPVCPAISAISQKNKREKEIKKLAVNWPELLEYYQLLQDDYASVKKEIPKHPLLKVSLVGELNTYALFAELASRLTGKDGFAAIIVKSALVTSTCYSSCFRHFVNQGLLSEVFLFDNREKLFQIDSREKFCVLFFGGEHAGGIKVHYGLTKQEQMLSSVPINVTSEELELINPETGLLPNVADSNEFSFLLRTHRSLSVFAKEFPKCHFGRLVHLTAHAEHISTKLEETRVPIYEGKFIEQYDNRFQHPFHLRKRQGFGFAHKFASPPLCRLDRSHAFPLQCRKPACRAGTSPERNSAKLPQTKNGSPLSGLRGQGTSIHREADYSAGGLSGPRVPRFQIPAAPGIWEVRGIRIPHRGRCRNP